MKIGIDARMYGPKVGGGGLGRYVEQLVNRLPAVDRENHYVLFVKKSDEVMKSWSDEVKKNSITSSLHHFTTFPTPIHWYTLREQLFLGSLIDAQNLDLVHFPHWNVPMNMKTPFIVTIHDLILLEQPRSARATTRHPLIYALKYLGYKKVLKHAIEKSRHIIAVSQYTKDAILKFFPNTPPEKITIIHEGLTTFNTPSSAPTPPTPSSAPTPSSPPTPLQPSLLYIGNSYPHKNLRRLIQTFERLTSAFPNLKLILAGRRDVFFDQIDAEIRYSPARDAIIHLADPTDEDLATLYTNATLYVFPSLSEGFGLPPLEAMQMNVPVVSSSATCLPEILGDAAVYMDPTSIADMSRTIASLLNNPIEQDRLRRKGHEQIKRYDWTKMTKHMVDMYIACGKR